MTDGAPPAGGAQPEPEPEPAPLLRVVRGEPDDAQLAALVAVLVARTAGGDTGPPEAPSAWVDRAAQVRGASTPGHGPGSWRASAWPR